MFLTTSFLISSLYTNFQFFHFFLCLVTSSMPVKVVEVKVDINCGKCNSQILEAVTEIEGVNKVALDEGKNELTVVGTMDPVCVASKLKNIKQKPVIISVGTPKPPEPVNPALVKPPPPAPVCNCKHSSCRSCDIVSVNTYESGSGCTIV